MLSVGEGGDRSWHGVGSSANRGGPMDRWTGGPMNRSGAGGHAVETVEESTGRSSEATALDLRAS